MLLNLSALLGPLHMLYHFLMQDTVLWSDTIPDGLVKQLHMLYIYSISPANEHF